VLGLVDCTGHTGTKRYAKLTLVCLFYMIRRGYEESISKE